MAARLLNIWTRDFWIYGRERINSLKRERSAVAACGVCHPSTASSVVLSTFWLHWLFESGSLNERTARYWRLRFFTRQSPMGNEWTNENAQMKMNENEKLSSSGQQAMISSERVTNSSHFCAHFIFIASSSSPSSCWNSPIQTQTRSSYTLAIVDMVMIAMIESNG